MKNNGSIGNNSPQGIPNDVPTCIVGLGYGDEGKGMTVGFLAENIRRNGGRPIVVRYNGGPQAAHNVRINGKHHTFSQFGAGFLSGADTVLSKYTLFQPYSAMKEAEALIKETGTNPLGTLSVDPNAPLLLPVHAQCNRMLETRRASNGHRHGSTGMGVGVARDYELAMHEDGTTDAIPTVADLSKPFRLADKMQAQAEWLGRRWGMDFHYTRETAEEQATELHLIYSDMTASGVEFIESKEALSDHRWTPDDVIFEGSQGILLDLRYGFFPHVTYGWMDADNARTLAKESNLPAPVIIGCTRTYSTRHGDGPFPPQHTFDVPEVDNGTGVWQGAFRTGLLDLPMLHYGASIVKPDVLSLSCMDLYPERVITRWRGDMNSIMEPSKYALSADAAIRREDDDSKWDPESVYAPLLAAEPVIESKDVDGLIGSIESTCSAPVVIKGHGPSIEEWRIA